MTDAEKAQAVLAHVQGLKVGDRVRRKPHIQYLDQLVMSDIGMVVAAAPDHGVVSVYWPNRTQYSYSFDQLIKVSE